jgi:hypothetical protein
VVGPGNIVRGLQQEAGFMVHVDGIQLYGQSHTTINGNYFANNSASLGAYDGGDTEVITNNIFENSSASGPYVQLLANANDVVTHNTFVVTTGGSLTLLIDNKSGFAISTNHLVRDNAFRGANILAACPTCTITHNMFSSGGLGTDNITGSPTFLGGTNPVTVAGFQFAPGSVGKGAGTDGQDMGTNYYGRGTNATPPQQPTNLHLVP